MCQREGPETGPSNRLQNRDMSEKRLPTGREDPAEPIQVPQGIQPPTFRPCPWSPVEGFRPSSAPASVTSWERKWRWMEVFLEPGSRA